MALTLRVADAVAIYKRLTPSGQVFRDRVELGYLIAGFTRRETDQYYQAVAEYRTALAKAESLTEWGESGLAQPLESSSGE